MIRDFFSKKNSKKNQMKRSTGGSPTLRGVKLFEALGPIAVTVTVADGVADPAGVDADAAPQELTVGAEPADGAGRGEITQGAVALANGPAALTSVVVLIEPVGTGEWRAALPSI